MILLIPALSELPICFWDIYGDQWIVFSSFNAALNKKSKLTAKCYIMIIDESTTRLILFKKKYSLLTLTYTKGFNSIIESMIEFLVPKQSQKEAWKKSSRVRYSNPWLLFALALITLITGPFFQSLTAIGFWMIFILQFVNRKTKWELSFYFSTYYALDIYRDLMKW